MARIVIETGLLLQQDADYCLRRDDGGEWAIDLDRKHMPLVGQRVSVAGHRVGFNRLSIIQIRSAAGRDD